MLVTNASPGEVCGYELLHKMGKQLIRDKTRVREAFLRLDKDEDGAISIEEWKETLQKGSPHFMGMQCTEDEIEAMVKIVDSNNDGEVSLIELEEALWAVQRKIKEANTVSKREKTSLENRNSSSKASSFGTSILTLDSKGARTASSGTEKDLWMDVSNSLKRNYGHALLKVKRLAHTSFHTFLCIFCPPDIYRKSNILCGKVSK